MAIDKVVSNSNTFRNEFINGDMNISQKSTSYALSTGADQFPDRWRQGAIYDTSAPSAVFNITQSTDVPSGEGFVKSMKWDCTTAQGTMGVLQGYGTQQRIEAQNLTHLAFGTSKAKNLALSFWIKSNKTGVYGIEIRSHDAARQFCQSYTIDSANTWEKKTISIPGDTAGSGIANDNGLGFWVRWFWAAGANIDGATLGSWGANATTIAPTNQVNLADSTSNELYMTGCQLEAGTTASDFEFDPVDVSLARCQRYYQLIGSGSDQPIGLGTYYNSSTVYVPSKLSPPMRTTPSVDQVTGTNHYIIYRNGGNDPFNSLAFDVGNTMFVDINNGDSVSGTAGQSGMVRLHNSSSKLGFKAEL